MAQSNSSSDDPATGGTRATRSFGSPRSTDVLSLFILWAVIGWVYWPALDTGEFWWTDESRHAMDGVFFLDLARDFPWRDPMEYAFQYFATYPALALNWYPPFFALVEAAFFAAFGITEAAARLSVLGFAAVGALCWYLWVKPYWGRGVAVLSFLLFLTVPGVLHWARSVMLEMPAVAMTIVSVLAFDRYLDRVSYSKALLAGSALALTLLLKQSTIFILPALMAYSVAAGKGGALWRREALLGYAIVGMALVFLVIHALKFGMLGLGATLGGLHESGHGAPSLSSWSRWALYPLALFQVGGMPLFLLSAVGLAHLALTKRRRQDWLLISWLICWYLMATVLFGVPGNVERYIMYALPAVALFVCRPMSVATNAYRGGRQLSTLTGVALLAWNLSAVSRQEHNYLAGYREAAAKVLTQQDAGLTLFAGKHDGNLIFQVRAQDDTRSHPVLRADKILVSMAVHKYFGMVSYVETEQDVLNVLDKYGIGLVVIESRDVVGLREFQLLADTLRGPQFERIADIAVRTNLKEFSDLSVQIYRYLNYQPGRRTEVAIPLPHMGREVKLLRPTYRQ